MDFLFFMIESTALRKFAVSYFLVHPTKPLCNLVNRITTTIKNRFFKEEIVFIKNKELTGRIVETTKTGYIVEIYDDNQSTPQKEEVKAEDLLRKDSATKNEVLGFILSVTRDTPLGRIVANNIIQELGIFKGQKPIKTEGRTKEKKEEVPVEKKDHWKTEEKEKELEEIEERRVSAKVEKILKIPSEIWKSPMDNYEVDRRILSTFAKIFIFSDFLKIKEITLDDFVDCLFSQDRNPSLFIEIVLKLLKSISHERRKSGKEGLRDMVSVASNIIYENPDLKNILNLIKPENQNENPEFIRIQWFAGDGNSKNWESYIKSFLFDVRTIYEVKVVTNQFSTGNSVIDESSPIDRLLLLSFLAETVVLGIRFRGYYDGIVEEYKEKERERNSLVQELRRLRGELLVTDGTEEIKTLIKKVEESMNKFNRECKPEIIRSRISKYGNISFYYVGNELFYEIENTFRRIERDNWPILISTFTVEKKKDSIFLESIRKYLRLA